MRAACHTLLFTGTLLFVGCGTSPPAATAQASDAPAAEVRKRAALVRLGNPTGKAFSTELARGEQAWVGILELAPELSVPEHRDPTEETIHVLSGGGTVTIDGKTYTVEAGDTIFMPANAAVSYRNGLEVTRAIQVFAGPGPASKYDGWGPT